MVLTACPRWYLLQIWKRLRKANEQMVEPASHSEDYKPKSVHHNEYVL